MKKKNIWTCEAYAIAKLENRNQHITKNGIIQIMRELKIKSYYPLTFDECDRIYSMLTAEYLTDEIARLIDSNVLKEKKMTGKYGDYYKIIPGKFFQDFQKAKPDFEERLEKILHDENPVPGLLGMPGLVCAYYEKCRRIFSGISSAQLEIYLELKRKALREDKQAVATIKTLQAMLEKN